MAELPEKAAAKNFVVAIAKFPRIAATTAVLASCATQFTRTFALLKKYKSNMMQ
jgi:hypothetical protein